MQQFEQQRPPPPSPKPAESPVTEANVRCGPEVRATLHANDPANQRPFTDAQIPLERLAKCELGGFTSHGPFRSVFFLVPKPAIFQRVRHFVSKQ